MTFTYQSPPATPKDEVRFWSTDTVSLPYSVSDEDIEFLLAPAQLDGNVMAAAAYVADRIANYWSKNETAGGGTVGIGPFSVGDVRSSSELEAAWRGLALRLRSGNVEGIPSIAGGLFTGSGHVEFSLGMQDSTHQRYRQRDREGVRPENGVW